MDAVRWEHRPQLRRPVLLAAFEGWNDAGDAASTAARYVAAAWDARTFAALDPEEFYDFTATRPQVRLQDGLTRRIVWPRVELQAASAPGSAHDIVILHGSEPQLRWRTFCDLLVALVKELRVEMVLTLGALLVDVAHTRPVRVTGTAADADLVARLGLRRSRYEGPTGIVGVLHDALARASIPAASLWAAVPHYVHQTPSPKATLALVERATALLGTHVDVVDLQVAAASYERQVSELVALDEDLAAYVARLEESEQDEEAEVASGDTLAAEVERFLKDHGRE
ncbi:MAG TPA: PAC2 family protein [Acidimicrobiales bacterium]|nr:PAC2 family protein [Acidimicrobiales bacterium]